jgi:hypothetical protein
MIKLIGIFLFAVGLPIGIVAARLLWRWGDVKIKELEDKRVDRYLK